MYLYIYIFGYIILGLYRDNGEENGNYHIIVGYIIIGVIWVVVKIS